MKYPQTQNEVFRVVDVSAIAYVAGFVAVVFAGAAVFSLYQLILCGCAAACFALSAYGFIVSFKAKAHLKAEGKWVKLSLRELMDLHWWRKGVA